MKKIIALFLAVILCLVIVGCGEKQETATNNGDEQDYYNGKVLAVYNNHIKVKCLDVIKGNIAEGAEVEVTKDIVAVNDIPDIIEALKPITNGRKIRG